jgi:adenosylcobinamide kinase/adenosylcobinamide-phosphate guanylyltransferase
MTVSTTLILGGARSGKSAFAEKCALESNKSVLYTATATAGDEEMTARIAAHRAARPPAWRTLEAPVRVGQSILENYGGEAGIIVDCITLLASNLLLALPEPIDEKAYAAALEEEAEALAACMKQIPAEEWWIVSNEVGLGLVPEYPLGRLYRDGLGRMNQRLAQVCGHVIFMAAGLPLRIK